MVLGHIFDCESQLFTRFKLIFGWKSSRKGWKCPGKRCGSNSLTCETQPCTLFWAFSHARIVKKLKGGDFHVKLRIFRCENWRKAWKIDIFTCETHSRRCENESRTLKSGFLSARIQEIRHRTLAKPFIYGLSCKRPFKFTKKKRDKLK